MPKTIKPSKIMQGPKPTNGHPSDISVFTLNSKHAIAGQVPGGQDLMKPTNPILPKGGKPKPTKIVKGPKIKTPTVKVISAKAPKLPKATKANFGKPPKR